MNRQFTNESKQATQNKRSWPPKKTVASHGPDHSILQLQRTIGNRGVLRLLESGQLGAKPSKAIANNETPAQLQGDRGEADNRAGLPRSLKAGLETLSGMDLSGIRVHNNSSKPAQLNALAYTQGQDIHVGPGQEKHLPHEGWHVVQQMQGRVTPTMQTNGVSINDDAGLEREADVMGAKATRIDSLQRSAGDPAAQALVTGVQRQPLIQRLAPIIAVGLTAPELASVVGAVTGVASAAGVAIATQRGKSGMDSEMKLEFTKNYLMTPAAISELENIARVLFYVEMDRLTEVEGSAEDKRTTAVGNVKQQITSVLDRDARTESQTFTANGDGGRTRSYRPWGAARIRVHHGIVAYQSFGTGIQERAERHGIQLRGTLITYVKSCIVDYEYQESDNIALNDNIWVRGQSLNHYEDQSGLLVIRCTIAFDWDADTTYFEWKDDSAICATTTEIPSPKWTGSSDPDD